MESYRIIQPQPLDRTGTYRPCEVCNKPFRKRGVDFQRPFCVECSPYAQQVARRVARRGVR